MSTNDTQPTEQPTMELTTDAYDKLYLHRQDDETLAETLERLLQLVPHPRDVRGGSARLTRSNCVIERIKDEDGLMMTLYYPSLEKLADANPNRIRRADESGYRTAANILQALETSARETGVPDHAETLEQAREIVEMHL